MGMLPPMGENEAEKGSKKRPISRRSFLAGGAAFGGAVLWGAAAAPSASGDTPPVGGAPAPPLLNTTTIPPIITATGASGPTGTSGATGITGGSGLSLTNIAGNNGETLGNNAQTYSGQGFFSFIPPFRFRFRSPRNPF